MFIKLKNRSVVEIAGKDSSKFLQGLITNDINKLDSKKAIYTCMLTPQGKFLFDFFVINDDGKLFVDIASVFLDNLIREFSIYKLRSDVSFNITEYDVAVSDKCFEGSYIDPRSDKMGYRGIVADCDATDSFEDYEKLRISLGIPDGEFDLIQNKSYPLQYKMEEINAIDFKKGCYIGQEVTARSKYRGNVKNKF